MIRSGNKKKTTFFPSTHTLDPFNWSTPCKPKKGLKKGEPFTIYTV